MLTKMYFFLQKKKKTKSIKPIPSQSSELFQSDNEIDIEFPSTPTHLDQIPSQECFIDKQLMEINLEDNYVEINEKQGTYQLMCQLLQIIFNKYILQTSKIFRSLAQPIQNNVMFQTVPIMLLHLKKLKVVLIALFITVN